MLRSYDIIYDNDNGNDDFGGESDYDDKEGGTDDNCDENRIMMILILVMIMMMMTMSLVNLEIRI